MLIIRPFTHRDIARIDEACALMEHFGGLTEHHLLFVGSPNVQAELNEARIRMLRECPNVSVMDLHTEGPMGWPVGPNFMFATTMMRLDQERVPGTRFWMEPDCLPRTSHWPDFIEAAFNARGARFCGNLVETPFYIPATGQPAKSPHGVDKMMMGCGLYCEGWTVIGEDFPALMQDLVNIGMPVQDPFDVYLRWAMGNLGVAHTPLIQDRWNTCNYRESNGEIICDAAPTQFARRDHSGPVDPKAACVHGCKDGSLGALILGESRYTPEEPVAAPPPPPQPPSTTMQAPARSTDVPTVVGQNVQLPPEVAALLVSKYGSLEAALVAMARAPQSETKQAPPAPPPMTLGERITELYDNAPQDEETPAYDLTSLAAQLGEPRDKVKAELLLLGFTLKSPRQWVTRPLVPA